MTNGKLLRVLGVGFGLAVIIGNVIGAGILRTPGDIAKGLPNEWLFVGVWILGGLYALVGSVSIAELGAMIPRAGGQYAFAHRAIGPYAGFVVGWSDWISTCGTTAAVSIVIGEYSGKLIPSLAGREVSIAVGTAIFFAVLQWRGVRWGSRTRGAHEPSEDARFLRVDRCLLHLRRSLGTRGKGRDADGRRFLHGAGRRAPSGDLHLRRLGRHHLLLRGGEGSGKGHPTLDVPRRRSHHRDLCAGERRVDIRGPARQARRLGVRRRRRSGKHLRPPRTATHSRARHSLDVERHQRLSHDGDANAVRDEPRRARPATGKARESRRDPDGGATRERDRRDPLHCVANVRSGRRHSRVLLRGELHAVVRVRIPSSPRRTDAPPAVPGVGISVDHGAFARGFRGVSGGGARRGVDEQPLGPGASRRQLSRVSDRPSRRAADRPRHGPRKRPKRSRK